jgi:hypothetical protein
MFLVYQFIRKEFQFPGVLSFKLKKEVMIIYASKKTLNIKRRNSNISTDDKNIHFLFYTVVLTFGTNKKIDLLESISWFITLFTVLQQTYCYSM